MNFDKVHSKHATVAQIVKVQISFTSWAPLPDIAAQSSVFEVCDKNV
jgi:hypothetical protein